MKRQNLLQNQQFYLESQSELQKNIKKKKDNRKYILIIGGSQGAKYFSGLIHKILEQLEKPTLNKIFIIHQAPSEDINKIKKFIKNLKLN